MTLSNRIKSRRKALSLTQTELAQRVGTTQQNIGKLEKEGNPKTGLIVPLAIALNCDAVWLERGIAPAPDDSVVNQNSLCINMLHLPLHQKNNALTSDVQTVIRSIEYDKEQAKKLFSTLDATTIKIINFAGDTMQGTFENGDTLYVDISKQRFDGDGIYVFSFEQHFYIKRLQLVKKKLIAISDNKNYRNWDITSDKMKQLTIHGKVVFSQSIRLKKHE
ncbi:phage repressor protein C with HTH and peptisase S24 domain [Orbus hercynius]|uniref:Phage repressor protein C with HTH and peptisase S24 domain n=1 Tax=Orbus hercynius TaxID=593135 RepID=A0A495RIU6_9GAMM|nr:S24 family peptidase [Orbus hercynius]RKS87417.1 phage repressor protein C with HTH and peptisase S24 domain [Orbus hercynius]